MARRMLSSSPWWIRDVTGREANFGARTCRRPLVKAAFKSSASGAAWARPAVTASVNTAGDTMTC